MSGSPRGLWFCQRAKSAESRVRAAGPGQEARQADARGAQGQTAPNFFLDPEARPPVTALSLPKDSAPEFASQEPQGASEVGLGTALTGRSPAWSGTSSPGRQSQRPGQGLRPPRPDPASGAAGARGPEAGVPRTWYSASSSLDRRLPEPPIAAARTAPTTVRWTPATSSLPPSGRVSAPSPRQRLLGGAPAPPLGSARAAELRDPAVPGEPGAGRGGESAGLPGAEPGPKAPPHVGGEAAARAWGRLRLR